MDIEVESDTYHTGDSKKRKNFETFEPLIRINGAVFFGAYRIPVKTLSRAHAQKLKIKSKHLQPGLNSFEVIYNWKVRNPQCNGFCCGF
jgi:hypothetical protein